MNASAKTAEMGINLQKGPFYSGDVSDFWHPILNICHILDIAGENRQFRHNCQSPRAGTFFAIIASPRTIFAKISIFARIASLQEATFGIQFKSLVAWVVAKFEQILCGRFGNILKQSLNGHKNSE